MNSNLFQTILTAAITICGILTSILLSVGCTTLPTGALDCSASTLGATWIPYLAIIASALGIVKLIVAAFQGKLVAPTAVVATTGAPGTVHPADVVAPK